MTRINPTTLLAGLTAPATVEAYAQCFRDYMEYAGDTQTALRAETLAAWRQHLVNETDLARSTINKAIYAVKSIVKALHEQKSVSRETYWEFRDVAALPANALMQRRRRNTHTRLTPDDVRALIAATDGEPCEPIRLYHRAFLLTLATTGARISEVVRIRAEDIREQGGGYVVTGVIAKAKGEPRDIPIAAEAVSAIRDWLHVRPHNSPYVFNLTGYGDGIAYTEGPVGRSTASLIVKRYAAKVGLSGVHPHTLRKFVGTELVRKKGIRVAQLQLGHASPATTAKFYDLNSLDTESVNGLF